MIIMITEDYVSYELAKLLKEKGFDESCYGRYSVRSKEFHLDTTKPCNNGGNFLYSAPTHQMAMKWLREVYKIYIDIETCYTYINKNENFEVTGYEFTIHSQYESCYEDYETYNSYEKAVEAALKYSLENLI